MNMKTTKFLAVLAVLAMAFAAVAIMPAQEQDAATGAASSPLADYSTAYTDGAVALGALKFTPYVQPTATAEFSEGQLTVGGLLVAESYSPRTDAWANIGYAEDTWNNTALMSYEISFDSSYKGGEAYYYVYQYNSLLPDNSGYKVTPLTATAAAVDKTNGANPSFEFALMNGATTPNPYITVKIIKSAEAIEFDLNAEDFNEYSAGVNVAVFDIKLASGTTNLYSENTTLITDDTADEITKGYALVRSDATITKTDGAASADLKGLSFTNAATLVVYTGATLEVNISGTVADTHNAFGIYAANKLDIVGTGITSGIVINDTTTSAEGWKHSETDGDSWNSAVSYGIGGWTQYALTFTDVVVDINQTEANTASFGSFGIVQAGLITISSSIVTIDSSNRAIQADAGLTINGGSLVTANGGEKGIIVKAPGLVLGDTDVTKSDSSVLTATVLEDVAYNGGLNDRWGLRASSCDVLVSKGATLNADAVLMRAGDINIYGTLNIYGSDIAGYYKVSGTTVTTYVPAGLIVSSSTDSDKIALGTNAAVVYVGAAINLSAGAAIAGLVSDTATDNTEDPSSTALFGTVDTTTTTAYTVNAIVALTATTISHGSVVISGDIIDVGGKIVVTGTAKISGSAEGIEIDLNNGAELIVPEGEDFDVTGAKIKGPAADNESAAFTILGTVSGTSTMTAADLAKVTVTANDPEAAKEVIPVVPISGAGKEIEDFDDLKQYKDDYALLIMTKPITINEDITLNETLTLDLAGYKLIISDGAAETSIYATLDGAKIIDSSADTTGLIQVIDFLTLKSADVCANLTVLDDEGKEAGYVTVTGAKEMTVTGKLNSNLAVGYGNTLKVSNLTIPSGMKVNVFGNMISEGYLTIEKGGRLSINMNGVATFDGATTVEGTMTNYGSTVVSGSMTVSKASGGAILTNNYMMTFNLGSTFNVLKGSQLDAGVNKFVSNGFTYVYGTAVISGTLSGSLIDCGIITFSGTSDDATIYLRDGVSLQADSVTGYLYVSDDDAAAAQIYDENFDVKEFVYVFDDNTIVLSNVSGMTISEEVKVTAGTITDDNVEKSVKYYASILTVSGTMSALNVIALDYEATLYPGNVSHDGYDVDWDTNKVDYGYIAVGDVTVGKNTSLVFSIDLITENPTGNSKVTGNVSVIAQNAAVEFDLGINSVDVEGQIFANDRDGQALIPNVFAGAVNATYYTYTATDGSINYVLEPFAAALEKVLDVTDKSLYVYGTQKVSSNATIPEKATVYINGTFSISKAAAVVTVESGALLDGSNGTIAVTGVLFVANKDNGLRFDSEKFTYSVKTENGSSVTYSGLAGALSRAVSGDVIEMAGDGTLKSDATVPEGVKLIVPAGIKLTVGSSSKEITFTIDGQLQVLRAGILKTTGKNPVLDINGSVLIDKDAKVNEAHFTVTDYVSFSMKVDGRPTSVGSNLTFAAENCTDGTVTVHGAVTADDIVFTPATDKTITISVPVSPDSKIINAIAADSITLNSGAKLDVDWTDTQNNNSGIFNGSVLMASETGVATIVMQDATGFVIEAKTVEVATGDEYHAKLSGTFEGKIAIMSGAVEIDDTFANKTTNTTYLYVGSDAGIVINGDVDATINAFADNNYDEPNAVFDGAVLVNGTLNIKGAVVINGLMTVVREKASEDAKVSVTANTDGTERGYVLLEGALIVSTDKTLYGTFELEGKNATYLASMDVGALSGLADAASIVGPVDIKGYAFINVYSGADLTLAMINWDEATSSSKAIYTDVYFEDELFVTTLAMSGQTIKLVDSAITADVEIPGYDIAGSVEATDDEDNPTYYLYWFTDVTADNKLKYGRANVGSYDAVYFYPASAKVEGTVTVGVGITLYVDGKIYDRTAVEQSDYLTVGKHTVSVQIHSGYVGDNVVLKFNGVNVPATATGGTIEVTPEMKHFTLVADGAEPYTPEPTPEPEKESEWTVTTILLCVLVVLIAIMAVIVALRLNRN